MAFVATAGAVAALSSKRISTPTRIMLSTMYSADYAEIWRTQESVRTVVSFLARNIAQLGLHTFERVGDTDRRRLEDHPLAVLLRRPNPWTSRYRFIQALVADFAIYDNAYWLKVKIDQTTNGLVRIPPTLVEIDGDDWLTPGGFKGKGTNRTITYPPDQIV